MTASIPSSDQIAGIPDPWLIELVAAGEPPFERGSAFEPSLLPHLARFVPVVAVTELLEATYVFAGSGHPLQWPQLDESVRNTLAGRFTDGELAGVGGAEPLEWAVRRCLVTGADPTPELWSAVLGLEAYATRVSYAARLLVLDPDPERFEAIGADLQNGWHDPETERCLLELALHLGRDHALLAPGAFEEYALAEPARAAHVLPSMPAARRAELADVIADAAAVRWVPPWMLALYVSRLAPHRRPGATWDAPVDPVEHPVWAECIERLRAAPVVDRDRDTRRAHPFGDVLDRVAGPHEIVVAVVRATLDRHGGAAQAGAPPDEVPPSPEPGDGRGAGDEPTGDRDVVGDLPPAFPPTEPSPTEPSPIEPSPTEPPPAPPSPEVDDRRLGIDLFADGRLLPNAAVAGVATEVEVSIGRSATAQVAVPMRVGFAPGVELRSLPVRFIGAGIDETRTLRLRRDPSTTGSVTFRVVPTTPELTALVIVHDEDCSVVLQAAALSATVVESLDEAMASPPSISLVRVDAAALSAAARPRSAAVVTDGTTTVATGPELALPASTDAAIRQIDDIVAAIERAAARFLAAEAPIDTALAGVARAGVRVRRDCGLDALDSFDRIQVVSLTGQSVFPMELVYRGDPPETDATLCTAWRAALGTGRCPVCGDTGRPDVVCPTRFWGLHKVIEHHRGEPAGSGDYSARVQLTGDLVAIGAPTSTVVAASSLVAGSLGEPASPPAARLAALVDAASRFGPVHVADDWAAWTALVAATAPDVLIAMPHHERVDDAGIQAAALELGGVFETTFAERHVRRSGASPGPLVMLIGCDTGVEERVLASFATQFRHWAPVVVATVGEVLADEAQNVAATVLAHVAMAAGAGTTVGEAVRDARRELLAQSRLAGLQLVLHGDASWRVGS